jgi:hypothetical protein
VALAAAVLAMPAVARADLAVTFDLTDATLVYTAGIPKTLDVTESNASQFTVNLEDMATTTVLDRARIYGSSPSPFDFLLAMNLTDLAGVDNWSAAGTLTFTDTDTSSNAVKADFTSSSIAIVNGATGYLEIKGYLLTSSGKDAILINRGDPWKFMGQASSTPDTPDADSVDGQITRGDRAAQDNGTLLVLKFAIGQTSLDTLFGGENRTIDAGEVKGSIVPAPAAIGLGLIGLGLIGWYMRRYA